ncbi:hypothetical protein O3M35_012954 [Rhynocoris fuscipes]|uniref:Chitin-binding type-2 domain-containing protein n=1 Tax=Rhynocoris fuscipes TaxID=488301 RepID=A0AAW1CF82_9HEMI
MSYSQIASNLLRSYTSEYCPTAVNVLNNYQNHDYRFFVQVESRVDQNGICTTQEKTCTNDCKAVAHCNGRGMIPLITYCYGSKPYCNRGQCTDLYTPQCNEPYNSIYYCPPEDGTYPDPYDCTRFHICLSGKPYSTFCGRPGLVFSTKTLSCVRQNNENDCGRISCYKNNTWQVYSNDARYAFLCVNTTDQLPLPGEVIRCKDNYAFNPETLQCEFKCQDETKVMKPNVTSNYIECSLLYGTEFTRIMRNCPNDQTVKSVFNPETSQCVLASNSTLQITTGK